MTQSEVPGFIKGSKNRLIKVLQIYTCIRFSVLYTCLQTWFGLTYIIKKTVEFVLCDNITKLRIIFVSYVIDNKQNTYNYP